MKLHENIFKVLRNLYFELPAILNPDTTNTEVSKEKKINRMAEMS